MSVSPKLLRVFFRGSEQRLKVFDGTPESSILNSIKKAFHITEDDSKIFIQDEDGDILVLPPNIPNGLCIHIFIEPSTNPTPSTTSTASHLLPGFKWQHISNLKGISITNNGYTISNDANANSNPTPVVSTETFNSGKIFIKINVKLNHYSSFGFVSASENFEKNIPVCDQDKEPFINPYYFADEPPIESVGAFGAFGDFDKRIAKFYYFENDKVKKKREMPIGNGPIKFFGWVKRFEMTIMEGGSSEIPSFCNT